MSTRCRRTSSPDSVEVTRVGNFILPLMLRRRRVRAFECFFFGTAIRKHPYGLEIVFSKLSDRGRFVNRLSDPQFFFERLRHYLRDHVTNVTIQASKLLYLGGA